MKVTLNHFLSSLDEVTLITMFVTIGFVVVLGYLMHALVSGESERVMSEQHEQASRRSKAQASSSGQQQSTAKVASDR